MIIQWLGHASFRLSLPGGDSLVTDPYAPSVGYDMPAHKARVVTISHDHDDHSHVGALAPDLIAREAKTYAIGNWRITGHSSYHDGVLGQKRGANVIYDIQAEGLRVVHLGDLGHMLTDEFISRIARPDVLLIPVGSVYTIDGRQAAELAKKIGARITVPMHYKTDRLAFELEDVEIFLSAMSEDFERVSALDVAAEGASVAVMEPGFGL